MQSNDPTAPPSNGAALAHPSSAHGGSADPHRASGSNGHALAAPALSQAPRGSHAASHGGGSPFAPQAQGGPRVAAGPAWLYAYQEAQRQTAEAHTAFQNAMAQAHIAFLQTAERGIAGLTAMATGAPMTMMAEAPATYVPQHLSTPASMPALAGPIYDAPAVAATPQPAYHAPAPIARAPIAHAPTVHTPTVHAPVAAPIAHAPVPASAPVPAPPAEARTSAAPLDAEALLLAVVADKTGYPTEMLELGMALEADLGIDSIKRVEILAAMMKQRPDLPQVDTKAMAALNTLGEIVAYMSAQLPGGAASAEPPRPKASSAATP